MRKTYIIGGVVAVLIAAAGAWYYASPGMTVKAMVEAAQKGDEARFSSYVDYAALRADLKSELTNRLQEEAKRDGSAEAKLGLAMGMAMMNPIVDSMVSPKGMTVAFANLARRQDAAKEGGKSPAEAKAVKGGIPADPEIRRQGLNSFVVSGKDTPDSGLVFERHGLGWKLSGIDLPALPAKAPAKP
ncbi:MAG TPA: DUF2939 domain-containing protein [Allosphingosinicella sp.]|jgi:hypothetical protein